MNASVEFAVGPRGGTRAIGVLPVGIACLLALDIALVVAPVIDFLVGSPYSAIRNWLHLDSEMSLPAWYSSMKWLAAALLFVSAPLYLWRQRLPGMPVLASLGCICLAFSIDEILGIHEWIGRQSDALLPDGRRAGTLFERTGIWPFLLGIPVMAILGALIVSARRLLGCTYRMTCVRLIAGFAIMSAGAVIVELGKNLIAPEHDTSGIALLQLSIEELLEMLGASIVVWSAYEFARGHGLRLICIAQDGSQKAP